ncbi:unnamed protein product [Cochlearia groenlandica]
MVKNSSFGRIMEEGDKPGFFKILRKDQDLSSETMRGIPQDFIKTIPYKEISLKMVLELPWGGSWLIKIFRNPIFYYMEKSGWDKFLSDNSLGDEEVLTFNHKGNMCFSVNIYQKDCMEMLSPKKNANFASSSRNIHKDVNKEEIDYDALSFSTYIGPETAESSTRRRLRHTHEVNLGKKKVEEADTLSFVPGFTITIRKSYLMFLGIPKKFADMYMPKETTKFKIHYFEDNNNKNKKKKKKSWEVTYVVSDVQARFSRGWVRLIKELSLVVGDVCNFELIKPTKMVLNVSRNVM